MRYKFLSLVLFLSVYAYAQTPENTHSLLWQITGNNLTKPSYLYGTMHVSNKIAFRLDDVFYQALDKAEYVALESDPNLWLDYYLDNENSIDFSNAYKKGFYKRGFSLEEPKQQEVTGMLGFDAQMLNNVLYRTNVTTQNFEEETYLDMFIYQAGKKFNKTFVPLEDVEESDYLVRKSEINAVKEKPDAWLLKRLEKDSYYNLLQNAYRERNIQFIDSLNSGFYTDNHLKYMLYERNKIMANGINTTVQKGSTFIGIGAAHLAGENGVIELLKKMGYTVTPLQSNKTKIAKNLKAKFEDTFNIKPYTRDTLDSGFLSLELPNKLYHFGTANGVSFFASPDLTNGAYFTMVRLSTFNYLPNATGLTLDKLEDMFFEGIPGTIISKNHITNSGYKGIEIINKLKNGDYQRYQIFKTPLEIVMLKLGGKKRFAIDNSDAIFNTVKFRDSKGTKWTTVTNFDKSFTVDVPEEYSFYNIEKSGKRLIQAYDAKTGAYFVLQRNTINDEEYLEEDNFELKHLQRRFYEGLELTPTYNSIVSNQGTPYLTSSAVVDSVNNKKMYVKSAINKADYYLLSAFNATQEQADAFFTSLHIKQPQYYKPFEKVTDTALFFTSVSTEKKPMVSRSGAYNSYNKNKNKKDYLSYEKETSYKNSNDEVVYVKLYKLHDYAMYANADSLWNDMYYQDREYNTFIKKTRSRTQKDNGTAVQEMWLTDTLSTRAIYVKSMLNNGAVYEIKTIIDTLQKPTGFVTEFYNNFVPADTVIGVSPFKDKTNLFFEKLRANDSLVTSAIWQVKFSEKNLDSLMEFITNFDFPDDKKSIRNKFVREVISMKDKRVKPFLNELYLNSYQDSYTQEIILDRIAENKTEASIDKIKDLFTKDFPVGINKVTFIASFADSLPLAKKFFPDMLDYTSIEDYKAPTYALLSELVETKNINPKIYKKLIGQLLNEAKIELKKQLRVDNSSRDSNKRYNYYGDNYNYKGTAYNRYSKKSDLMLAEYTTILYPYRKNKKVAEFLDKLSMVKDEQFKIKYLAIQKQFGENITAKDVEPYAKDINTRLSAYYILTSKKLGNIFPKAYSVQDSLNIANLYAFNEYEKEVDKYEFISKHSVNNKYGDFEVYIYKVTSRNYNNKEVEKLKMFAIKKGTEPTIRFEYNESTSFKEYETIEKQVEDLLQEVEFEGRERVSTSDYNGYGGYGY